MKGCLRALSILVIGLVTAPVEAGFTYGFFGITNNNAGDVAVGANQLSVDLSSRRNNRVRVRFDNVGLDASSITDVYFDDSLGVFDSIYQIKNTGGVSFSEGAAPGNLAGGNMLDPAFQSTLGLNADSDPPVQINGVNPGEQLTLYLQIAAGSAFSDVVDAINSSALRIGIHVQGFNSGGSESFVNMTPSGPPPVVPEPSGLALAGLAAVGLVFRRRRKQGAARSTDQ